MAAPAGAALERPGPVRHAVPATEDRASGPDRAPGDHDGAAPAPPSAGDLPVAPPRAAPTAGQARADARTLSRAFAARAGAHDRDASFPHENMAALHASGLLALSVPAALGGGGHGLRLACDVVGTVAEGCAATALVLAMQLVHQRQVARSGRFPMALRERVGRAAVEHGALINALRVEPALGTPARGGLPATVARRAADGSWRLSGHKIYSTGAPGLTWGLCFARTDEPAPRVGQFLLPLRATDGGFAPGVRMEETWDQLGLRASGSHDLLLDDVSLPAEHALDLAPPGPPAPDPEGTAWQCLVVAGLYTGVARAARDWFTAFLHARAPSSLGASLATLPRMQDLLGGVEALLGANRRLLDSAARDVDEGHPPSPVECGLLKTTCAENAIEAVQRVVAAAGNPALSRREPLERHLRDVLCARIHTPQADAARLAAGRAALGL